MCEGTEIVDEELAIEVVGLVLDRPAQQVFGFEVDLLALMLFIRCFVAFFTTNESLNDFMWTIEKIFGRSLLIESHLGNVTCCRASNCRTPCGR